MLAPKSVVFLGCVGRDKYADILQDAVRQAELRVEYRIDDEHPTGRCGVIITGHNRSMCTDLAAANHYKLEHLKQPEIWKLVEQARVYYVGGYHLTVCVPAIMALAEEAAASKDKLFGLSLSAPFIPKFFKDQLDQTAPYWDFVMGNETEASSYAESHGLEVSFIIYLLSRFHFRSPPTQEEILLADSPTEHRRCPRHSETPCSAAQEEHFPSPRRHHHAGNQSHRRGRVVDFLLAFVDRA